MKLNKDEKQLIETIKSLPKVTDYRTKDEILQAISKEQTKQVHKEKKTKTFIPIFSAFSVVIALFLIFIVFNNNDFTIEEQSSEDFDSSTAIEKSEKYGEINDVNEEEALFNDLSALQIENPLNVQFSIEREGDQLSFILKDGTIVKDEHQYVLMIESILMVAKSYRFHTVLFENSPIEQVGPYNLSEPIGIY